MKILGLFGLGFVYLLAGSVHAAVVEGLYEAQVPVANQSSQTRTQAMSSALVEVFAKISGKPNAHTMGNLAKQIEKPARFIQQYRYRKIKDKSKYDESLGPDAQLLWLRFDKKAINKALRKNDLPVWGRTRPATLVWLAVEADGQRYLVSTETQNEMSDALKQESARRGMAILLPLMDLEDQMALNFADVWGDFQEAIMRASSRYKADAVLVGRINITGGDEWLGRWTLYNGSQGLTWESQSGLVNYMVDGAMLGALEILSAVYNKVFSDDQPGEFRLAVNNVNNLQAYAKVARYLKSLQQVKKVQAAQIGASDVHYVLDIRGSAEGLIQTIALGNMLEKQALQGVMQAEKTSLGPNDLGGNLGSNTNAGDDLSNSLPFNQQALSTEYSYRLLP